MKKHFLKKILNAVFALFFPWSRTVEEDREQLSSGRRSRLKLSSTLDSLIASYQVSSPVSGGGGGSVSVDEAGAHLLSARAAEIHSVLIKGILGPLTRRDVIVHYYEEGYRAGPIYDRFTHVHFYSPGPSNCISVSNGQNRTDLEMEQIPISVLVADKTGKVLGEVMERNLFIYGNSSLSFRETLSDAESLARLLHCCALQILRTRLSRKDREQSASNLALDFFYYLSSVSSSGVKLPQYWNAWLEESRDWEVFQARFRKAYLRACDFDNVIRVAPGYGSIMVVTDPISLASATAERYLLLFDLLCPFELPRVFRSVPGNTLEHELQLDQGFRKSAEFGRLVEEMLDAFKVKS